MNEPVVFVAVHAHARTPDGVYSLQDDAAYCSHRQTGLGPGGSKAGGVCETEHGSQEA